MKLPSITEMYEFANQRYMDKIRQPIRPIIAKMPFKMLFMDSENQVFEYWAQQKLWVYKCMVFTDKK